MLAIEGYAGAVASLQKRPGSCGRQVQWVGATPSSRLTANRDEGVAPTIASRCLGYKRKTL